MARIVVRQSSDQLRRGGTLWAKMGPVHLSLHGGDAPTLFESYSGSRRRAGHDAEPRAWADRRQRAATRATNSPMCCGDALSTSRGRRVRDGTVRIYALGGSHRLGRGPHGVRVQRALHSASLSRPGSRCLIPLLSFQATESVRRSRPRPSTVLEGRRSRPRVRHPTRWPHRPEGGQEPPAEGHARLGRAQSRVILKGPLTTPIGLRLSVHQRPDSQDVRPVRERATRAHDSCLGGATRTSIWC